MPLAFKIYPPGLSHNFDNSPKLDHQALPLAKSLSPDDGVIGFGKHLGPGLPPPSACPSPQVCPSVFSPPMNANDSLPPLEKGMVRIVYPLSVSFMGPLKKRISEQAYLDIPLKEFLTSDAYKTFGSPEVRKHLVSDACFKGVLRFPTRLCTLRWEYWEILDLNGDGKFTPGDKILFSDQTLEELGSPEIQSKIGTIGLSTLNRMHFGDFDSYLKLFNALYDELRTGSKTAVKARFDDLKDFADQHGISLQADLEAKSMAATEVFKKQNELTKLLISNPSDLKNVLKLFQEIKELWISKPNLLLPTHNPILNNSVVTSQIRDAIFVKAGEDPAFTEAEAKCAFSLIEKVYEGMDLPPMFSPAEKNAILVSSQGNTPIYHLLAAEKEVQAPTPDFPKIQEHLHLAKQAAHKLADGPDMWRIHYLRRREFLKQLRPEEAKLLRASRQIANFEPKNSKERDLIQRFEALCVHLTFDELLEEISLKAGAKKSLDQTYQGTLHWERAWDLMESEKFRDAAAELKQSMKFFWKGGTTRTVGKFGEIYQSVKMFLRAEDWVPGTRFF